MQNLLPNKFKIIGLLIFIIVILGMVFTKLLTPGFVNTNRDLLKPILKAVLVLCLLIIILSKEKIEDEFINHCRLRAFTFAFLCSALSGLVSILWSEESIFESSGFQVICTQLFTYLFMFYILKSSLFNNVK